MSQYIVYGTDTMRTILADAERSGKLRRAVYVTRADVERAVAGLFVSGPRGWSS